MEYYKRIVWMCLVWVSGFGYAAQGEMPLLTMTLPPMPEVLEYIDVLSGKISQGGLEEKGEISRLYHERATLLFLMGESTAALEDLDVILSGLDPQINEEREWSATLLWTRIWCHAFTGSLDNTLKDVQLMRSTFLEDAYASHLVGLMESEQGLLGEKKEGDGLTPEACHERVRGLANVAKNLSLYIQDGSIRWLINTLLEEIEHFGFKCCRDAPEWDRCLDPIVCAWHRLQSSWDKMRTLFHHYLSEMPSDSMEESVTGCVMHW